MEITEQEKHYIEFIRKITEFSLVAQDNLSKIMSSDESFDVSAHSRKESLNLGGKFGKLYIQYLKMITFKDGLLQPSDKEIKRKRDSFIKYCQYSMNQGRMDDSKLSLLIHVYLNIIEECNEVIQRVTKCLRFGYTERQNENEEPNTVRLRTEMADFVACYYMILLIDRLWDDIQKKNEFASRYI